MIFFIIIVFYIPIINLIIPCCKWSIFLIGPLYCAVTEALALVSVFPSFNVAVFLKLTAPSFYGKLLSSIVVV